VTSTSQETACASQVNELTGGLEVSGKASPLTGSTTEEAAERARRRAALIAAAEEADALEEQKAAQRYAMLSDVCCSFQA
jgi:hypothetical protein